MSLGIELAIPPNKVMAITPIDIMLEKLGRLKKWQEDNGASDKWYITVNGRVLENPMPLANVEMFLKRGSSAISALHADQVGDSDPQWIELINQHEADIVKNTALKEQKEAIELHSRNPKIKATKPSKNIKAKSSLGILGSKEDVKQALILGGVVLLAIPLIFAIIWGGIFLSETGPIQSARDYLEPKEESVVEPKIKKTPPAQPSFRKDQIIAVKVVTSGGDVKFTGGRFSRSYITPRRTRYEVTYLDDDGIERTVTRSYDPTKE